MWRGYTVKLDKVSGLYSTRKYARERMTLPAGPKEPGSEIEVRNPADLPISYYLFQGVV